MKANPKAEIAFIAACLISKKEASTVYDEGQSKYMNMSGTVNDSQVNIYDYDQGCYMTGDGSDGAYKLYHFGDGHYIDLKITGDQFEGYDYGSGAYFRQRRWRRDFDI